ncbi:MAG: DUF5106 domain-containing protein [Candidatus Symbiothrix sp.]|jgi:hypothetical protein|nr:DUF5106 domain-containing protein [Candidatus Symbiothrix sp.]
MNKIITRFVAISMMMLSMTAFSQSFALPEMPDSLTDPRDRANYLVLHYWDNFIFQYTLLTQNATEQAFVDYVNIMPHAAKDTVVLSINNMLTTADKEPTGKLYSYFLELAEKYLYEMSSPVHNDEYYIPVAEHIIANKRLPDIESVRPTYRLNHLLKNRAGTTATDIEYTAMTNAVIGYETKKLSDIVADYTLLLFYNPECGHCVEAIKALKASAVIESLTSSGKLRILAFYPSNDVDTWKQFTSNLPKNWFNGFDKEFKVTNSTSPTYELRQLPTMYLLDKDKTILMKELTVEAVEKYFVD